MSEAVRPREDDPARWRQVRALLTQRRHELSQAAAGLYPDLPRVAGTGLLARPEWLLDAPAPLADVELQWVARPPAPVSSGLGALSEHLRPRRPSGERFASYAEAIAALDRPALFENRVCYRLLEADLAAPRAPGRRPAARGPADGRAGGEGPGLRLSLSRARFFDAVSLGHALAHEFAGAWDSAPGPVALDDLPLRASVGDPCLLARRPAVPAVITVTLRRERSGEAAFFLHWRDPAKVAHAGGAYQVIPAGVFQPASDAPAAERHDLSLWRAMVREFSEEFLGTAEIVAGGGGRLDYDGWPFHRRLAAAREAGAMSVWLLGVGVDPLTAATDILTAAVIDADTFDDVFAGLVAENAEGRLLRQDGSAGIPFTRGNVERLSDEGAPVQAAGAALLRLAWRCRAALLG